MEKRYGRSGKYTESEWKDVIEMKKHESQVHASLAPRKASLVTELKSRLATAGVAAANIDRLAKMIQRDRLDVQWSSATMKAKVEAIVAWYEKAMGEVALDQIERNNEIHQYGK
jgi:hypothetical protein